VVISESGQTSTLSSDDSSLLGEP